MNDKKLTQSYDLCKSRSIQSLSLIVPPIFANKNNYHNRDLVCVKFKTLLFPAQIFISKKAKQNYTLLNNGCIPPEITSKQFSVSAGYHYLFAKSVTLSAQSLITFTCEAVNIIHMDMDKCVPIDVSEFDDMNNLQQFLLHELINQSICFKPGMKINLRYLSKNYIFLIEDIVKCYYEIPDKYIPDLAYKCFNETSLKILDKKTVISSVKKKCSTKIAYFGGYDSQLKEILSILNSLIETSKTNISGVLISGPPGCGKSMIGDLLFSLFSENCIIVRSDDIISSYIGEGEATLKKIFDNLKARAPAFLFIDDIDELCSDRDKGGHSGIVNSLLHLMSGVMENSDMDTLVICTATQPQILDPALRRPGRLSHDIILAVPTESERSGILKKIFERSQEDTMDECHLSLIASKTHGFTGGDLMRLVSETYSYSDNPSIEHYMDAMKIIKPSSLRNVSATSYEVKWNDVYGYSELKGSMLNEFKITLLHRELFLESGITPPSRFLLFGPPGCGKTLMVHALAHEFNLRVIPIKRSNVFGKYFGESEKNLATLFEQAQKSSPCILHFENFDGLASRRKKDAESTSDVEGRLINHLKVLLDGVVGYENVFVMAETNRPDLLDKDVIRHGRFHRYFYISLPNKEDQTFLICALLQLEENNLVVALLLQETEGFTMAETKLFVSEIKKKVEELNVISRIESLSEGTLLNMFEDVRDRVYPNVSARMVKKLEEFRSVYCPK